MCEQCTLLAEQNDALQQRAVSDRERIDALVNTVTEKDHKLATLKGQLTKLRTDSPKMADAQEVFDFWVRRLKKNANTTFGPKRQEKVIARLKEKSLTRDGDRKDDLKWAVRGCEALPFVGPRGRQAGNSQGARRHDNLALICQDEENVERFMGYADDHADAKFRSLVHALDRCFGQGELDVIYEEDSPVAHPICLVSVCPACNVEWALKALPGRSFFPDWIWLECSSACAPSRVLETLRGLDAKPRLQVAA